VRIPARLTLATRNPGKIREILEICVGWPASWDTALEPSVAARLPDVEETGETYRENALLKAAAAAAALDLPAIADDSGIEVDALGGRPGPRSARFAGEHATDEENLRLLIDRLADMPSAPRTARYRCVAACWWPEGTSVLAEGVCEGRLIDRPRGTGGFGYDPIFVPTGQTATMAELPPEDKNRISHRGAAFRALRRAIESRSSPAGDPAGFEGEPGPPHARLGAADEPRPRKDMDPP
jgi:XTP/dITP diphosphohydrolase